MASGLFESGSAGLRDAATKGRLVPMKIAHCAAIPLNLEIELAAAGVARRTNLSCVLVKLEADDGTIGTGFAAITEEEVVAAAIEQVAASAVIQRIDAETRKAVADPAIVETLTKQGVVPAAGSSEARARGLRAEVQRCEGLIKQANIKPQ